MAKKNRPRSSSSRRRVTVIPKVLYKLFGNRARTLADTIISLIPPLPLTAVVKCRRCKGRRCLGCCGISFLLRPKDSTDYYKLLNQCYVVVSDNAPPLSGFYPEKRWSQLEVSRKFLLFFLFYPSIQHSNLQLLVYTHRWHTL